MRCSCPNCDTYMVHSESCELGCVCPACLTRCKACLGTNTGVSRDAIREMREIAQKANQPAKQNPNACADCGAAKEIHRNIIE